MIPALNPEKNEKLDPEDTPIQINKFNKAILRKNKICIGNGQYIDFKLSDELIELSERVQRTSLDGHDIDQIHYTDFETERAGFEVNFAGI